MFKNYVVNLVCSGGHLTTWNSPHEIHHMMFKRRGEGVKGFLNNVQKNCTFLTGRLPLLESGQSHLIHSHPRMTEWCQNDKSGSFHGHFQRNDGWMKCFHPCHSSIIPSFRGRSDSKWPTNDKKSQSKVIPVTSPNLTFVCTIFLQTLWQGHGGLQEWTWNDIGMTLEWQKDDEMALEWLGWHKNDLSD